MNPTNFPTRRKMRIEDCVKRQAEYDTLTPVQKLALLDAKLGAGVGAKKQRARLARLAVSVAEVVSEPPGKAPSQPKKKK